MSALRQRRCTLHSDLDTCEGGDAQSRSEYQTVGIFVKPDHCILLSPVLKISAQLL